MCVRKSEDPGSISVGKLREEAILKSVALTPVRVGSAGPFGVTVVSCVE